MKNKIIIFILILSVILIVCLALFGFKIGGLQIFSISDLANHNKNVDSKIDELTTLSSSGYTTAASNLDQTINTFRIQKEKYEQLAGFESDDGEELLETQNYDISYLWTTIGKYATKNNINLKMDVKKATGTDLYDLDFTIQGEYTSVSTFVSKIENDSDLNFRIYNFKLTKGKSDKELKGTFTVKDVNIDNKTLTADAGTKTNTNTNTNTNTTQNNTTTSSNTVNNSVQ